MISCDKMREDSLTSLSFTSFEQDNEASEDASCNSEQNDHHDDKSQKESDADTHDNDENCDDGSSISQSTGSIDAAFEDDDDDNDEENNSKKQHEKQNWKWNLSFSSKSTEDNTNSHHMQQRQQHNSQETVHAKEKNYSQKSIEHLEENQVELRAGNVVLSTALTKQVDTSSKGDDKPNRNFGSDTSEHKKNKKNVESSRRRRQQNRIPHRSSSNRSLGHRSNNSSHHHPQQQQQQQLSNGSRKSLRHSSHHCGYTTDIKKSARRRRSMNINSSRQNEHNGTSNKKIGSSLGDESIHNNTDRSLNYHGNNSDSSKRRVSWKSDSKASFSDWTIKISYRDAVYNQHQLDEYHIHKNVTGFGYRKSEYLLRDFQKQELRNVIKDNSSSSNNSSSNNNNNNEVAATTTIKLPTEIQARAFPMVLDFLYYTKEIKQKLTAEMSCNIFKLSELLEIPALSKAIGEFYMKNLTLKNLGDFLTAATKARADKLLTICKAKIGQMITENPKLSGFVPPKFMADILLISRKQLDEARLKEPEKYTEDLVVSQSRYWSKAACICAAQNETVLTPKLFERLTSSESLPYIDASATPKLLSIEAILIGNSTTLHTSNNTKTGVNAQQLTSLQERCVESISNDFDTFQKCFDSSQAVSESLKNLPSNVLTEILLKSLNR